MITTCRKNTSYTRENTYRLNLHKWQFTYSDVKKHTLRSTEVTFRRRVGVDYIYHVKKAGNKWAGPSARLVGANRPIGGREFSGELGRRFPGRAEPSLGRTRPAVPGESARPVQGRRPIRFPGEFCPVSGEPAGRLP